MDETQDPREILRQAKRKQHNCDFKKCLPDPDMCKCMDETNDEITALEAAGKRIVDLEPTEEMVEALADAYDEGALDDAALTAALAVSPTYSQGGDDV